MSLYQRLSILSNLNLPSSDYAIGNATAAVAHGLLDPKKRKIHDLDVYVSGRMFEKLAKQFKTIVRHTSEGNYSGAFPVIFPSETSEIEIFRSDIYPFNNYDLPGEKELLDSAVSHDFGADIGFMPILSVDNLLTIKKKFDRPQDQSDLVEMLRILNNQAQFYHTTSTHSGNIFTSNFLYLSTYFR